MNLPPKVPQERITIALLLRFSIAGRGKQRDLPSVGKPLGSQVMLHFQQRLTC